MKDKEKMKETAAEQIIEAVEFANIVSVNAADTGTTLSASLFRNIRDAIFHFKAMCDCMEEDEAVRHFYSLKEHLTRGEKDAVISFGKSVADAVFDLIQMSDLDNCFEEEDIAVFRQSTHMIKNIFMDMRTDGMHVKEKPGISVRDAWFSIMRQTEIINDICHKRGVHLF